MKVLEYRNKDDGIMLTHKAIVGVSNSLKVGDGLFDEFICGWDTAVKTRYNPYEYDIWGVSIKELGVGLLEVYWNSFRDKVRDLGIIRSRLSNKNKREC